MEVKMTKCPKCNSSNVFTKKGSGVGFDAVIWVGLGIGMKSTSEWVTYLCVECGYFENYLVHQDWLNKIKMEPEKHNWRKSE